MSLRLCRYKLIVLKNKPLKYQKKYNTKDAHLEAVKKAYPNDSKKPSDLLILTFIQT
jgi:hypothetical protein